MSWVMLEVLKSHEIEIFGNKVVQICSCVNTEDVDDSGRVFVPECYECEFGEKSSPRLHPGLVLTDEGVKLKHFVQTVLPRADEEGEYEGR